MASRSPERPSVAVSEAGSPEPLQLPSAVSSPTTTQLGAAWQRCFMAAVRHQRVTQVVPFQSMVSSFAETRRQLTESKENAGKLQSQLSAVTAAKELLQEELTKAQYALKGVAFKSNREKELEQANAELNEQIRGALSRTQDYYQMKQDLQELQSAHSAVTTERNALREQVATFSKQLAERDNVVVLLKQEVGALQSENQLQREQFAATKEENNRIVPMIMQAKAREAELMDQLLQLEQKLTAATKQRDLVQSPLDSTRERTFCDELVTQLPSGAATRPSYAAWVTENCHEGDIVALTIAESGKQIWTGGTDRFLRGWDITNGASGPKVSSGAAVLCLDSNAGIIVAGCSDATCRVFDLASLRGRCQLTGHSEKITASYLNPDASRVYTASSDRSLRSWDLARGGNLLNTTLCFSAVNDLAVSNDKICSAHYDTTLRFWDARTGKAFAELPKAHDKTITSVRYTRGGYHVVTLGRDNVVKQFDVRTMQEVFALSSPQLQVASNVTRLTLSPDDRYVAVGNSNGTVLLWELVAQAAPHELCNGHKHGATVPVVCWNPNGGGLASAAADRRLIYWR